jgi:hypothetical protein
MYPDSYTCKRGSWLLRDGTRITVESTHPRGRIRVDKERDTLSDAPSPPLAIKSSRKETK